MLRIHQKHVKVSPFKKFSSGFSSCSAFQGACYILTMYELTIVTKFIRLYCVMFLAYLVYKIFIFGGTLIEISHDYAC